MESIASEPRSGRGRRGLWREAAPVALLLVVLAASAVALHTLGRAYLLVFSMNVSMVTLALTLLVYRRYRDWRVLSLALLFLWNTVQQTATSTVEILDRQAPIWIGWLSATPLVVPTFLGFAAVVYLWRVFQVQAEMQSREQRLAERTRQAQRLESLGVMAGGIAHDFSNLLTTIIGNAALIQMDVPADTETASAARSIQEAAERAAAISRQMLDYSGCGRFRVQRLDLARLAEHLMPLLHASLPKRVRLLVETSSEPAVEVMGDASQLEQVVVNLVTNGAEAIAAGGEVTIRTAVCLADEGRLASGANSDTLAPGRYAVLEVCDTGAGMDEVTRQRMFDPFFSTRTVGRGMGLAAVLGIVRGHHGTICVDSASGRGTRVQVLLPVAVADDAAPAPCSAARGG